MESKKMQYVLGCIVLAGITIGFTGCESSRMDNLKPAPNKTESSIHAHLVEENPDNDLNYLGEYHNQSLNHLGEEDCIDTNKNTRYDKIKAFMDDSLSGDHFLGFNETENEYEDFPGDTAGDRSGMINLSTDYFPDYLKNNASLSSDVESYFESMEDHYQNFSNTDSLVSDLESLESDVKADSTLNASQTDLLLGALAVARNDLAYWDHVRDDTGHPWHEPFTEDLTSSEAETLMLHMSLSSGVGFALIYDRARDNQYPAEDRLSAASVQAAFNVGPVIVDTGK